MGNQSQHPAARTQRDINRRKEAHRRVRVAVASIEAILKKHWDDLTREEYDEIDQAKNTLKKVGISQ